MKLQTYFFTEGALSYNPVIKSSLITSRLVQSRKLVITLFVSSITYVFFSLNLAIKVGSSSLQQGSNSCLRPFAKLAQTLIEV